MEQIKIIPFGIKYGFDQEGSIYEKEDCEKVWSLKLEKLDNDDDDLYRPPRNKDIKVIARKYDFLGGIHKDGS